MLAISERIRNNILPSCLGLYDVYAQEHPGKTIVIVHVVVTRGTEKLYYLKRLFLVVLAFAQAFL